jgi:hypothetical protein
MASTSHNKILVLDNDECIGAWSFASGLHSLFSSYIPTNTGIKTDICIQVLKSGLLKYYFNNGGARPGTKDTLKLAKISKDIGTIDKVIMYTSASNNNGWVDFLKECLEEFADVKGVYDLVLHKDNSSKVVISDGATYKYMSLVLEKLQYSKNTEIFMVDDKPHNIIGDAVKIAVSQYRHIVDKKYIVEMIDEFISTLQPMCSNPSTFWYSLKELILGDKGFKYDVYFNTQVLKCPLDQLLDKNLIEKCARMFIFNINTVQPICSKDTYDIIDQHSTLKLQRCSSV